ncbi:MAG: helix-turn-helix domain-containing protein [Lachnospiraceae bacterium]
MQTNMGENVRRLRTVKGLTQEQLAQAIGISQTRWFAGLGSHRREPLDLSCVLRYRTNYNGEYGQRFNRICFDM